MKGGMGVLIDPNNMENNFISFLQHSKVQYLSEGNYGITFKAMLQMDGAFESPYKQLDVEHFQEPVTSLIVKISVLGNYIENFTPQPIDHADFYREVNIQTDIFMKTMDTMMPLCPAIVFSHLYESTDSQPEILDLLIDRLEEQDRVENEQTLSIVRNRFKGYTVIAMELMEEFDTVDSYIKYTKIDKPMIINCVAMLLIELTMRTGYAHGDFHNNNIMYSLNDRHFMKNIIYGEMYRTFGGIMMLIDFGFTRKLEPEEFNRFKQLPSNIEKMNFLCQTESALDSIPGDYYPICYNNATKDTQRNTPLRQHLDNHLIQRVKNAYDQARDERIQIFNAKEPSKRGNVFLPLSNAIKKRMFPGLTIRESPVSAVQLELDRQMRIHRKDMREGRPRVDGSPYEFPFEESSSPDGLTTNGGFGRGRGKRRRKSKRKKRTGKRTRNRRKTKRVRFLL